MDGQPSVAPPGTACHLQVVDFDFETKIEKDISLAEVRDARLIDGPWHAGTEHSQAQSCMKMVEYDANPNSPYNPAFRL